MQHEQVPQVLNVLRRVLHEKAEEPSDNSILMETDIDKLDLDSLGKLEMVMELEEEFDIMLNESEIVSCKNVGDLVSLVIRAGNPIG